MKLKISTARTQSAMATASAVPGRPSPLKGEVTVRPIAEPKVSKTKAIAEARMAPAIIAPQSTYGRAPIVVVSTDAAGSPNRDLSTMINYPKLVAQQYQADLYKGSRRRRAVCFYDPKLTGVPRGTAQP